MNLEIIKLQNDALLLISVKGDYFSFTIDLTDFNYTNPTITGKIRKTIDDVESADFNVTFDAGIVTVELTPTESKKLNSLSDYANKQYILKNINSLTKNYFDIQLLEDDKVFTIINGYLVLLPEVSL